MSVRNVLFALELVPEGLPDKLAYRIDDTVLGAFLRQAPSGRVTCEIFWRTSAAQSRASSYPPGTDTLCAALKRALTIVSEALPGVGHQDSVSGTTPECCEARLRLNGQFGDIYQRVNCDVATDSSGEPVAA